MGICPKKQYNKALLSRSIQSRVDRFQSTDTSERNDNCDECCSRQVHGEQESILGVVRESFFEQVS